VRVAPALCLLLLVASCSNRRQGDLSAPPHPVAPAVTPEVTRLATVQQGRLDPTPEGPWYAVTASGIGRVGEPPLLQLTDGRASDLDRQALTLDPVFRRTFRRLPEPRPALAVAPEVPAQTVVELVYTLARSEAEGLSFVVDGGALPVELPRMRPPVGLGVVPDEERPPTTSLALRVTAAGVEAYAEADALGAGCAEAGEGPAVPRGEASHLNLEDVVSCLRALKEAHPEEAHLAIGAAPDVPFAELAQVWAVARGTEEAPLYPRPWLSSRPNEEARAGVGPETGLGSLGHLTPLLPAGRHGPSARIRVGQGRGDGIDVALARDVVRRHYARIRICVESHIPVSVTEGRLEVALRFNGAGNVLESRVVESSVPSAELRQCVAEAFRSWVWPHPRGVAEATLQLPVSFERIRR
jgi:hypothetical protein